VVYSTSGVALFLKDRSTPSVLVLGASGMLGRVCVKEFRARGFDTYAGQHREPGAPGYFSAENSSSIRELVDVHRPEYVLNCVGVLAGKQLELDSKARAQAITVNALFPLELARAAEPHGARILHMSTDGVFSDSQPAAIYTEDDPPDATDAYGKTKALGESPDDNVLNIRCSIIGVEPTGHRGLVEWFLQQGEGTTVRGFENVRWNGVTTIQFARVCASLIAGKHFDSLRSSRHVHHLCPNPSTTKFALLVELNRILGLRCSIESGNSSDQQFGRLLGSLDGTLNTLAPEPRSWSFLLTELLATR
jgi:dTDP-4-dehydrorhamnose reductase